MPPPAASTTATTGSSAVPWRRSLSRAESRRDRDPWRAGAGRVAAARRRTVRRLRTGVDHVAFVTARCRLAVEKMTVRVERCNWVTIGFAATVTARSQTHRRCWVIRPTTLLTDCHSMPLLTTTQRPAASPPPADPRRPRRRASPSPPGPPARPTPRRCPPASRATTTPRPSSQLATGALAAHDAFATDRDARRLRRLRRGPQRHRRRRRRRDAASTRRRSARRGREADHAHQEALLAALSQLGVAYRHATSDPAVGFDCSGLTSYAWGRAGVEIPHQSGVADQRRRPRATPRPPSPATSCSTRAT